MKDEILKCNSILFVVSSRIFFRQHTWDLTNIYIFGVTVKPKIKRQSQNFQGCSTKPGEKCILTCEVEYSVPQPNITWKYQRPNCRNMSQFLTCYPVANMWRTPPKDIGQVNVTLDRFGQNSYKSTFIISSGLQNGFFRCTATNALGTDNYMVRMRRDGKEAIMYLSRRSRGEGIAWNRQLYDPHEKRW